MDNDATKKMTNLRPIFLKFHLYVGLAASVFLVTEGLTGSILAFAQEYDHWLHPSLWRVAPQGTKLSEQALARQVERGLAPGVNVAAIDVNGDHRAQVFDLTDGRRLFVNAYSGAVLGIRDRPTRVDKFIAVVHGIHVCLLAGNVGELVVESATAVLFLLIPTGLYLWWEKKRFSVKWTASWRRILWDLHNLTGLYGCVFVVVLAATGLLVANEKALYWIADSKPWSFGVLPHSTEPLASRQHIDPPTLDQVMFTADHALPGAAIYQIKLPMRPTSVIQVLKRGPGLAGHSTVYIDRYTATVLRVDEISLLPRAYRAHFVNQSIHMGTILGLPSEIVLSVSSLALVASVITGMVIWWRRVLT